MRLPALLCWLFLTSLPVFLLGQTRTLDLQRPATPPLQYDYSRDHPRFRSLIPEERKCTQVENEQTHSLQHADQHESDTTFERWLDREVKELQQTRSLRRTRSPEVQTLPVVVHVIYGNGLENISDEQALSQIEVLNQDYRRQNPNRSRTPTQFEDRAVDTGIEFCLAGIDPQGRPTNGIHRVSMSGGPFTERQVNELIKPTTIWDPTRYLNIWVCNLANGILGFAQFPVSSGLSGVPLTSDIAAQDGVVIHYSVFGTIGTVSAPFDQGRTATHEIGHFLGLRHIWGDGPCNQDDFCQDTPPTASAHYACPASAIACGGGEAMVQNFMDYTDDACMTLFTRDQRNRMQAVLASSPRRASLTRSQVCAAGVTPPQPAFTANLQAGCAPLEVQFANRTEGPAESLEWTFTGGKPRRSSDPNPVVSYRKAGIYPVSLRVTNAAGSGSHEEQGYIRVSAAGATLPLVLDFEADSFPPQGFLRHNPQQAGTWELATQAGAFGRSAHAILADNYHNNLIGSRNWLLSPTLDLGGAKGLRLRFDVAYTSHSDRYSDSLGVFVAAGCQTSFKAVYFKGGRELATAPPYQNEFLPQPQEWRTETIDLSAFDGQPVVQLAFVNFSGHGNRLYLDNIRLESDQQLPPRSVFALSDTLICAGDTLRLTDQSLHKPTNWAWALPGAVPAADTVRNPVVHYPEPGFYAITLTTRNANGSHDTTLKRVVHVLPQPELSLTASKDSICAGEEIALTARGQGSFRWVLEKGLPQPQGNTLLVQPAQDQTYGLETLPSEGCPAAVRLTVRVRPVPPLQVNPPTATICPGETVKLNATGAATYRWYPGEGLSQTQSAFTEASPSRTLTYTLQGITPDGCELKTEVTVTVADPAVPLQLDASDTELCPGETATLTASGAASYRWSPGFGLNTTEGDIVVAAPAEPTVYTVTGRNEAGCKQQAQVRILPRPTPSLRLTASSDSLCPGDRVSLTAAGAASYRWAPETALTQTEGPRAEGYPTSSVVYSVIGLDEYGCADTASFPVGVAPSPEIELVAEPPVICLGSATTLIATGGRDYRWEPMRGLRRLGFNQMLAQPGQDQTYTVTAQGPQGCPGQASVTVEVAQGAYPEARFTASETMVCAGQIVTFETQGGKAVEYFWEFPGGTPTTSTEARPEVAYFQEGVFDVVLTVRGCDGREDRQVTAGYIVVTSALNLTLNTSDRTICRESPFELVASGAQTYSWGPDRYLNRTEGPSVVVSPKQTTTYTVTGRDRNGCVAERSVTLSVTGEGKKLGVSPIAPVICRGESVPLQASGAASYFWGPKTGLNTILGPQVVAKPEKTTTYVVEATDYDGCLFTDSVTVQVRASTPLQVSPAQPAICAGERLNLRVEGNGTFQWSPATGLSRATGRVVEAFPQQTTTYRITGTGPEGCTVSGEVTVKVQKGTELFALADDMVLCQGESTNLRARGEGPFSWKIKDGASIGSGAQRLVSPTQTTTYILSNGAACGTDQAVTLKVLKPRPLQILPEAPRVCTGKSVTLTVEGGNGYVWDDAPGLNQIAGSQVTVRPRETTRYQVFAVDEQGCESDGVVTVTVDQGDFLRLSGSATTVCAGSELALVAEGGEAYEWLDRPEAPTYARTYVRPEAETTYRVAATNEGGCRDTASLRIEVNRLQGQIEASQTYVDLAQENGLVNFSAQAKGATTFAWEFGAKGSSAEAQPSHLFRTVGRYPVTLQVSDGVCQAVVQEEVLVVNTSSLDDLRDLGQVELQPAEAGDRLALKLELPRPMRLQYRLLDEAGRELLSEELRLRPGPYEQVLDLSKFGIGPFYVELSDGVDREVLAVE